MCNDSECRIFEQYMNDFIDSRLIGVKLWLFLNHVRKCPACYEELETRYLLSEALTRLENGETIELQKELSHKVEVSRRMLRFHRVLDGVMRTLEILSGIVVAYSLYELIVGIFGNS